MTGRDLDITLSPSFCFWILFAIVVQQIKLKFLVQRRELKWLILNNWRRLFHWSRVKFPLVRMSASWCLESINVTNFDFGSKFILSNNQSRATLWVRETCLIVRLLPLVIMLITDSLSSKTYNIAPNWEGLTLDETWSTFLRSRSACLVEFCFSCGVWCSATSFLWLLIFEFLLIWFGEEWPCVNLHRGKWFQLL